MGERFKMRFEATADLCGFLNVCAANAVSLGNFASDRMDMVAFETDLPLSEIKALLAQVTDGHVMLDTIAPIGNFTGKQYEGETNLARLGAPLT